MGAHSLILGMTESGKTSLAKYQIEKIYKPHGIKTLVLDPLCDPDWKADFQTDDPAEFIKVLFASRKCAAFIDESGVSVGRYAGEMEKCATLSRHAGHSVSFLSQRATQMSRTVRDQCSRLYLFTTALEDCKVHAREWNAPELLDAAKFKKGQFFYAERFGAPRRSRLPWAEPFCK